MVDRDCRLIFTHPLANARCQHRNTKNIITQFMENKLLCIFAACLTVFTSCNLKHGGKPRQPAADYIECRLFQIDDRNEDDPQSMCNDPRTIKMRFVAFNKTGTYEESKDYLQEE